jgi:hypothetical protein
MAEPVNSGNRDNLSSVGNENTPPDNEKVTEIFKKAQTLLGNGYADCKLQLKGIAQKLEKPFEDEMMRQKAKQ